MKIERHYEYVENYLVNRRDEWVKIYEVYAYGVNDLNIWYFSSLVDAKSYASIRKNIGLVDDTYIKELHCYIDKVGIIWVRYIHTIDD